MSDSEHSTVTYTSVPFPVEDDSDIGSPGIDGPPIMPEDPYAYIMAAYEVPPSPDYIPGPEVPPSPDYIPGPEVPPSPDYIPGPEEPQSPPPLDFVPEPMYPEYMPQEDEILPAEEQPLPAAAASPTADSPGYVPESDPEEDDEDPEEDPADYPADGDDDDDEDEDEDEDEEEEEHPALADSVPPVHRMTARISIRDEPSISLPPREEVERLLALTTCHTPRRGLDGIRVRGRDNSGDALVCTLSVDVVGGSGFASALRSIALIMQYEEDRLSMALSHRDRMRVPFLAGFIVAYGRCADSWERD
ncbi:hypothetical protein Tco_0588136 [Tanacetum coccineum]